MSYCALGFRFQIRRCERRRVPYLAGRPLSNEERPRTRFVCAVRSAESFANVEDQKVHVMALLYTFVCAGDISMNERDIFHSPGERRRCNYPLGQTMPLTSPQINSLLSRRRRQRKHQRYQLIQHDSHLMTNSRNIGSSARRGSTCCQHSNRLTHIEKYWEMAAHLAISP